jgi:hypothetical protein
MDQPNDNQLSIVLIALMKGVVYADDNALLWQHLLTFQARVRDYVYLLGLQLALYEDEGFAWLQNLEITEGDTGLPRLVPKRQLSYPVSLLLALLRRKLAEHDSGSSEDRLILDRDDIVELLRTFLPAGANEARLVDQIDVYINKIIELGFARRLRNDPRKIEVRRILKAFIDAQWLNEFDQRLQSYLGHSQTEDEVRE